MAERGKTDRLFFSSFFQKLYVLSIKNCARPKADRASVWRFKAGDRIEGARFLGEIYHFVFLKNSFRGHNFLQWPFYLLWTK